VEIITNGESEEIWKKWMKSQATGLLQITNFSRNLLPSGLLL
jgi:hypothetical protein